MELLLAKYGKLTPLREAEEEAFRNLAVQRRSFERGQTLISDEFDEPDQLFIVESGRLFASSDLPNGERAITRLYFAGDIVGTANVPFEKATQTITVNAPSVLYVFPRANLIKAFTDLPRVAAIFYTFAALENTILNDRLVSIGRTRGKARLAALILEVATRHNLTYEVEEEWFRMGLTQAQMGDAIGLTEVQVNRVMRELDVGGLIERRGDQMKIVAVDELCDVGHFQDRYQDLDIEWFKEIID